MSPSPVNLSPLEILKRRLVEHHQRLANTSAWRERFDDAALAALFTTQQEDGSWADIDYAGTSQFVPGSWQAVLHLQRLATMATAIRAGFVDESKTRGVDAVVRGLDFWFARKPVCTDNYWHRAIGVNLPVSIIVVLMEAWLRPDQKEAALNELHYGVQDLDGDGVYEYHYSELGMPATGQNLLWLADIHLHAALLKNSEIEVAAAASALSSVLTISTDEGINIDYSFLQHGRQIYSGGYGASFACDAARLAALFHGLPFAPSLEKIAVLRGYFLEGLQWTIRRRAWDPMVIGRQIGRRRDTRVSGSIIQAIGDMCVGDPAFADAYKAMIKHMDGRDDATLVGNKHFYCADYSVHRRPGYSLHTRLSSTRTMITETGNRENVENCYLSQGTNALLLDGDEYEEIFPCWHWDRIPGGTAPERRPAPATRLWGQPGSLPFSGGVSNGTYGVSIQDLDWDGVIAKKSWFCFDDDIVCLGTDVQFYPRNLPLYTTLNQAVKKSDVLVEYGEGRGDIAPPTPGAMLRAPKWVHHANVGYVFPTTTDVELRNETGIVGDWHTISPGLYGPGTLETRDIFCLTIPHGKAPERDRYAYVLLPAQSAEFVRRYAASPQSRIVSNTPLVQAVRNEAKRITGIVFWKPGEIRLTPDLAVSVDKRCVLLVDESSDVDLAISVSRCEDGGPVRVGLDVGSTPRQTVVFDLPGGNGVGRTVTQLVRIGGERGAQCGEGFGSR